jgi:transcriptional regulator with XRE-family HTH domain
VPSNRSTADHGRPSSVLALNIRGYRILRDMTQDLLAAKMTVLGHGWSRSIVSAIESGRRGVTIDEVFGLAILFGVTIGRLLDPSGPDGSRGVGLDVGLGGAGHSRPLSARLSRLFAGSRAVLRLVDDETGTIDVDIPPAAETHSPPD